MTGAKQLSGEAVIVRHDGLLTTEVDGELMAMSIDRGVCFALDPIGTKIWGYIASPISLDALCALLGDEYEVDAASCRRDVIRLIEQLAAEGLASVESRG